MTHEELAGVVARLQDRVAELQQQNERLVGVVEELAGVVGRLQDQVADHLGIAPDLEDLAEAPPGRLVVEVERYLRERAEGGAW